jgi:hypothetical protein
MTSLAVALAVDSRGPNALYIVTDSRITFLSGGGGVWNIGQKTFASTRSPDIFGFVGDSIFPPAVLRQLLDQVNCGLLYDEAVDAQQRHSILLRTFRRAINQRSGTVPISDFAVFHGARDGQLMKSNFRLWETRYFAQSKTWKDYERKLLTDRSYFAHIDGSGANYVINRGKEWISTDAEGTSRAAIWSFCNALREGGDRYSGGAPQLVGIWRVGTAQVFGFRWNGKPYVAGAEVSKSFAVNFENIRWFNHRFQRCDGVTGKRLKSAARHSKPKKISALGVAAASSRRPAH